MDYHYIYVLRSVADGDWYTGYAHDLGKRIDEHKAGKVFSTKNRRPLQLIYSEACLNKYDALAREKYLKSGMGKRFLRNRMKLYLENL